MADFDPPFAVDGFRRLPTTTEQEQGFGCGPLKRDLLNGLFYLIEAELGDLHTYAGIVGSNASHTKTREAVLALIAAATGGGVTSDYVLMSQARVRLPIFPDVLNVDGRISVTAPSTGTVRLAGGVTFQHRGIFPVTTVQTDFATSASQIYHLRWDPTNGYRLLNLTNIVYNPSGDPETAAKFDSTFDDMLIARVITNSSNVATITELANKARLQTSYTAAAAAGTDGRTLTHTIDWARTGISLLSGMTPPGLNRDSDYDIRVTQNTRYQTQVYSWAWQAAPATIMSSPGYTFTHIGF